MDRKLLVLLLKKSNVFTFDEALCYFNSYDDSICDAILNREDFDADKFFEKISSDDVFCILAKDSKAFDLRVNELSTEKLICAMDKTTYWIGAPVIRERINEMTAENFIAFFNVVTKNHNLRESDMSGFLNNLISEISDPWIVYYLIRDIGDKLLKNYFCQNSFFLAEFISGKENSGKLDIAVMADSEYLWNMLFEDEAFLEYFNSLDHIALIRIAKNTTEDVVEKKVFEVPFISEVLLLSYAYETNKTSAWKRIFSSNILLCTNAIESGFSVENVKRGIDKVILEREDIIQYLNSIDSDQAIKMMKAYQSIPLLRFLLDNKNLQFKSEPLLKVLFEYKENEDVWKVALLRKEIISYFKTFNAKELIKYAEKHDCVFLWRYVISIIPISFACSIATSKADTYLAEIVFGRLNESSSPKNYVSLAKILKRDEIWRKAISIESVRNYIG